MALMDQVREVARHPSIVFVVPRGKVAVRARLRELESQRIRRVQERFFRAHPDGLLATKYGKIYLQREPHFLTAELIETGTHEPVTTSLFESLLTPSSTVVDIGANIGWFTLVAARRAARVYAYEPEPENFRLLSQSVAENQFQNVVLERAAISDHVGQIQ
ncbi:MAG: FkbM family methyltransferase, partial [Thermoplasmata archaeon]|nr:FkbM family methyltransferase [Thermoplasmata archaeon]